MTDTEGPAGAGQGDGDADGEYEQGRAAGIRQAVAWLQADYPYGDMPDWRQNAVDWIEDHARDERLARLGAVT